MGAADVNHVIVLKQRLHAEGGEKHGFHFNVYYCRPIQILLLGGDYFPELMPCSEQVCFCFNQLSSELKMPIIYANSA